MHPSRALALLLAAVAFLAPLAVASDLPDATWTGGVYDGGDEDVLLALVWDQTPALAVAAPAPAAPDVVSLAVLPTSRALAAVRDTVLEPRAPPFAQACR